MNQQFNTHALASSGAVVAAVSMLLLGIGANIGVYEGAALMMQQWHMFYAPTFVGTITGMIEAAVITYISILVIVWIYGLLGGEKN